MSKISEQVRKNFKENDDIRDAGLVTPSGIVRYNDIVYGGDRYWQKLDVYRPTGANEKLPVIISVHGGAWMYGDKERYQYYCMELAKEGFAVINFTYRLAPEYKFPAPLEDTALVIDWMVENSIQYGFDLKNVFALGDSAGAHILAKYILLITNNYFKDVLYTKYGVKVKYNICTLSQARIRPDADACIKAVALNCGVYRLNERDLECYIPEYMPKGGNEEELKIMDIPSLVTEDFSPTYLMTGSEDFLKRQPIYMAEVFTQKNVPFVYRMYGDGINKLTHIFHCDIKSKDGIQCNKDECKFFRSFI